MKEATSVAATPGVGEELEPALEGREDVDAVPHRDPGMRVEGDHRRLEPGVDRRSQHRPVPEVDAVERADRDRAGPALELGRCVRDPHAPRTAASRGSASSRGTTRSSSASSTENGPISVRRRLTQ